MKTILLTLTIWLLLPVPAHGGEVGSAGRVLITKFEGLRLCQYLDPIGLPTRCYGHLDKPGEVFPQCMTRRQCWELFEHDLRPVEKCVGGLAAVKGNQFDALASFSYNLGCGTLQSSTLLKRINAKAPDEAVGEQFMRWVYAGGQKLKGLILRRWAEKELYSAD